MNWFVGNIAEAVAQTKAKNAIFVVYVEGKDENTQKLSKFLNEPVIREKLETDNFVAIKIHSDSEAYLQFASIYKIVPIPSIFFIGKSGAPLEIVTGVMNTVDELNIKIVKVVEMAGKSLASMSQTQTINSMNGDCINNIGNENSDISKTDQEKMKEIHNTNVQNSDVSDKNAEFICVDDVCFKKPITTTVAMATTTTELQGNNLENKENNGNDNAVMPTTSKSMQMLNVAAAVADTDKGEQKKLEETRKYLEQKRRERIEEEQRLEKERELKRRQDGKVIQNLRQWQHEQELKELQENIKREKMEAQAARERIRAQIAADKVERAQKFAQATTPTTSTLTSTMAATSNNVVGVDAASTSTSASTATPAEMRTVAMDETRLQFRFASGLSVNHVFKCTTTLGEIRDYVIDELLPGTGIKDFILATTYPKREFTDEHNAMNLLELSLTPSAVILVIGKGNNVAASVVSRSGGLLSMLNSVIWNVLNPIIAVVVTTCNWFQRRIRGSGAGYSGRRNINSAQKRLNDENITQNDSVKRRNLDRFINAQEPSTSSNNNNKKNNEDKNNTVYRRYMGNSNIHRLSDNRKDSDDENATWNGNSTQQQ